LQLPSSLQWQKPHWQWQNTNIFLRPISNSAAIADKSVVVTHKTPMGGGKTQIILLQVAVWVCGHDCAK
jgi:hypothetical protein